MLVVLGRMAQGAYRDGLARRSRGRRLLLALRRRRVDRAVRHDLPPAMTARRDAVLLSRMLRFGLLVRARGAGALVVPARGSRAHRPIELAQGQQLLRRELLDVPRPRRGRNRERTVAPGSRARVGGLHARAAGGCRWRTRVSSRCARSHGSPTRRSPRSSPTSPRSRPAARPSRTWTRRAGTSPYGFELFLEQLLRVSRRRRDRRLRRRRSDRSVPLSAGCHAGRRGDPGSDPA